MDGVSATTCGPLAVDDVDLPRDVADLGVLLHLLVAFRKRI